MAHSLGHQNVDDGSMAHLDAAHLHLKLAIDMAWPYQAGSAHVTLSDTIPQFIDPADIAA